MASNIEEGDDDMAAERELSDDAMWKVIQKNTFTRWTNEQLKGSKLVINDLEKDLADGLKLIALIENLSGKKFQKYNKKPNFRTQKFENVTMSLKFLEVSEGIKIVNIDSSDIVDQKLKLIMGLIWSLILHYSITMPTWEDDDSGASKDLTPKQRLLAWIQNKIPEKNITNFTSDWNDGTAIAALVDALAPGLCPDWPNMSPKNNVPNAREAMDLAEKWMDIPQVIKPEEMCYPKVDELSMMTYLSRFPSAKLKQGAPVTQAVNAARVRAYGPGLEAKGNVVGAPARFIVETANAGKADLDVVVLNPKGVQEKCELIFNNDRTLSYNCVYIPSVEGQYKVTIKYGGKDIPKCPYLVTVAGKGGDATKVIAQGPGVEKTGVVVNRKTYFEVITKGAGVGVVDIGVVDSQNRTVKSTVTKKSDDVWYVEYTATVTGLHSVNVFFAGVAIPKSPFAVGVSPEGGPMVDASKLPAKPVTCTPKDAAAASLATPLKAAPGSTAPDAGEKQPAQPRAGDGKPGAPAAAPAGKAPAAGAAPAAPAADKPLPIDAKKCWASGRGIQPKGVRVGDFADFKVHTEGAGNAEPRVLVMGPGGMAVQTTVKKVNTTSECTYKPLKPGLYIINVTFGGQQIPKSPFRVEVGPTRMSKVNAFGPGLEKGTINQPATFTVQPNGEGPIGFKIEGPSQAKIDVVKEPATGNMQVSYLPTAPGEYAVRVLVNQDDIPKSPFMADIKPLGAETPAGAPAASPAFDASKVTASGPGLERDGVTTNKLAEFTVDTRQAGQAQLSVSIVDVDNKQVEVAIVDNKNGTFTCRYTATRSVKYTITITYGGVNITNSPYQIFAKDLAGDVSKVKVYGPAIEQPVKTGTATYLIVDCKEAGPGEPRVILNDDKGGSVPVKVINKNDGTFQVEFTVTMTGIYTAIVMFANQPVPKNPFKITVQSGVDVSKVVVKGLPETVPVNKEVTFEVVTAGAGQGQTKVNIVSQSGAVVQATVEDKPEVSTCRFTPTQPGPYTVQVTFADQPVPNSPFKVFAEAPNPFRVKVYGPAVEKPVIVNEPTYLIVDFKEAGPGEPLVTLVDDKGVPVRINTLDNKDKTYRVEFVASTLGTYTVNVSFANQPVPNSPFKVTVQSRVDASKVKVYGPAVENPVLAKHSTYLVVDCKEAGPGEPEVVLTTDSGVQIPVNKYNNNDRTYRVEFTATVVGSVTASVLFDHHPVPNSPFKINVQPGGVDVSKVRVPDLPKVITVGKETPFNIVTAEAGKGQAKVNLVSPSGKVIPSPVEEKPDGFVGKVTAEEPGPHVVQVTFAEQPVPNSPFHVDAVLPDGAPAGGVDASKVKAYGTGLNKGTVNAPCDFTIDTSAAGPGSLGLTIDGPTEAKIECFDKGGGLFDVRYWPTEPGEYTTNILFDDKPVPNSPFKAQVNPTTLVDVSGVKTYGPGLQPSGVFLDSVTEFTVDAASVVPKGAGNVKVLITNPSGTLSEGIVKNNNNGTYTCLYTPFEQGPNKIDVTYEGMKVPNSPFTVGVTPGCDPSRVKVYGPGIEGGKPNQPSKFTINTRGAGQGGIGLSVVGPTEPRVGCEDNQDGTLAVEYFPDSPGEYEIGVTFNEQNVPGSPFRVNIQESSPFYPDKVKCFGPGLNPRGVRRGEKAVFSVVTNQAGVANLEVFTTDVRTGQRKPAQIKQLPSGSYDVEYTPEAEGPVKIDVLYGGQHVPNSPFTTESQVGQDITKVALSGDGIKPHVPATVPVTFTVDTKQAGPAPVEVEIKTPQGKTVAPNISATPEGTYTVSYTPEELGAYTIIVKYAGQVLPSGPIHISAVPSGNAEKVIVPGNIRPVLAVGETCSFTIQKSQAGIGRATCRVTKVSSTTTTATSTEVKTEVIENGDGTVTIKYTVLEEGVYAVDLKFGGAPVPNGHFTQKVGQVVEETVQAVQTASTESAVFQQQEAVIQAVQAASTEAAPTPSSEYRPVELPTISIGPNINLVSAVITKPSGQKHVPKIVDNGNGSIKVVHHPTETGPHTLDVTYDSVPVPGSPFNFYVHSTKPGQASAFGPGLIGGKVGQPASFTVVTKDAGPGGLGLSIEGPSKAEIQCKDNKDGTATITYTPVTPGDYKIIIKFAGQMIPGGPFTAKISGGETVIGQSQLSSSSQITQSTQQSTSRESHVTTGSTTTHQMSVTITETDLSSLTATIRSPSGHEEPCGLKRQPNGQLGISFTPREVGEHFVNVFRNGQPIPGSPFKIIINQSEVGNASRVQVIGTGIQHGVANELNEFTINTKEAGVAGLSISVQGPGKVDIKCTENPDGTTRVTYKPTEPGNYNMTIKYGEQNIPGSPFTINVGGVSSGRVKESIVRQQQAATISSVGTTCELNITMAGINVHEIEGTVTSPSGATDKCEVVDLGNNRFTIKFFPKEMGIHTVSLKHKGLHIPGSPFQFTVGPIVGGGPEKVRAIGSGLERGEANKPCAFTVITREAGAGGLSMGIEGPSKAVIDFQDRRDGTSDVTYTCSEPGEYLVSVKFNGQHIPDSPFKVYMLPSGGDSKKLNIQNLQQHGLQVNTQTQFLVDFNGAQGKLNAKVVSPSGTESEAVVQEVQNGRFSVNFVPRESGVHYVHITLNGNHVPGSPYPVQVGGVEADAGRVRAYGAGLSTGQSGKECKFIVNTVNAGSGALNVGISGPSKAELRGREVDEGYEFSYTPMAPGDYLITIKYAGNSHIPGSPFKAHIEGIGTPTAWSESSRVTMQTVKRTTTTTTSQQQQVQQQVQQQQQSQPAVEEKAPDATKVVALGNGLLQCQVNQEATFVVHGGDAGFNMLLVGIAGPRIPCEKILIEHQGNLKYTVKYQLSQPGNYTLVVKWGDQHIPGSPYKIVAK